MTRLTRSVLALAVTIAACGGDGAGPIPSSTTVTSPAGPTTTTRSTAPPPWSPDIRLTSCQAPPVDVSLLCEAVSVIERHHVDPFEPDVLVAAALLGLDEVPPGDGPVSQDPVVCPVPAPGFEAVCEEFGRRVAEGTPLEAAVEGLVEGMFRYGLDPYSAYVSPTVAEIVAEPGTGVVPWVGILIGLEDDAGVPCPVAGPGCEVVVQSVLSFGSGEAAGVLAGDVLVEVAGTPVTGATADEIVVRFAAPRSTDVQVVLRRDEIRLSKTLQVEELRFEPVELTALGSGYYRLRINDFSQQAASDVGEALRAVAAAETASRGLVLDLRGNPGGLVRAAQAVASQFLTEGVVMVEQGDDPRQWPVIPGGLAPDLDIAVVVDGGTASAAEIVAATLADAGRAVVVGSPTFGKDIVQDRFAARNGGAFVVSVSRWVSPAGTNVGVLGLQPDVPVEDPPTPTEDPAIEEALRLLGA